MPISDRDRAILDFERSWWTLPGPKDQEIRRRLGMSKGRYYRLLASLIDDTDADAYDPLTVRRLRRTRDQRRRARFEGASGHRAPRQTAPRQAGAASRARRQGR